MGATRGFSGASGDQEQDNYGDIGSDYKAYNKRKNSATRRGLSDGSTIVSYTYPRNHVSYYKESRPDDVLRMSETREMGSLKASDNQLNNLVKKDQGGSDALNIVSASEDTAASGA